MKSLLRSIIYTFVFAISFTVSAFGATVPPNDTEMAAIINLQIKKHQKELYYPLSLKLFYNSNGNKLAWIAPDTVKTHATDAMLLLDCVLQYGLNHANYHPNKLLYDELRLLTSGTASVSKERKAMFDIWLTDAMLAFENNLHYGRFNPDYPAGKIDANGGDHFNAAVILKAALQSEEFAAAITSVQPRSKIYHDLKHQMYLETGLYTSDCYEFPQKEIQSMAINMERLRWYSVSKKTPVEINIPSQILTVHLPDSDVYFKLKMTRARVMALAKLLTSSGPVTLSVLQGHVVLHSIPVINKHLQELSGFSLIEGAADQPIDISVLKSKKLVNLLSHQDFKKVNANAIPVKLTYITCEINGGILINYKDIYSLNNGLAMALYHVATKPN
jgi:murein L,D-transpeptidase YcbB/YkuD